MRGGRVVRSGAEMFIWLNAGDEIAGGEAHLRERSIFVSGGAVTRGARDGGGKTLFPETKNVVVLRWHEAFHRTGIDADEGGGGHKISKRDVSLARGPFRGRLPAFRLETEYFALLKAGRAYPGRPWGEAVKSWSANAGKWSAAQLDVALDALLAADMALKSTRVSSEEQVIESLILAMCAPNRAGVAA